MNSVEKNNLIQKAICCSGNKAKEVADLYLSGNKCANEEFKKLFLLLSYTETLGCYQAPLEVTEYATTATTPVLTILTVIVPCAIWDSIPNSSSSVGVTVNGVETSALCSGVTTFGNSFLSVLDDLSIGHSVSICSGGNYTITITALCNTTSLTLTTYLSSGALPPILIATAYIGVVTVAGSCLTYILTPTTTITEYTNCLTEDEADSLANNIALLCNLCDEH